MVTRTSLYARSAAGVRPLSFLVDIDAPCSVIGWKELNRVLYKMGKYRRVIRPSNRRFRFGDVSHRSKGKIRLAMETPPGIRSIQVDLDIVDARVPALLGMDVLDREKLIPDTLNDRLARRSAVKSPDGKTVYIEDCSVPMTRSQSNHT